ncbi:hypothetical protein DL96DRAFT_1714180 [Flagelloscypha sp. PMI_526]|nr:hypothetical protein DL96DRAFT_1714180 [Flagelloscypha sp. PMI_526]
MLKTTFAILSLLVAVAFAAPADIGIRAPEPGYGDSVLQSLCLLRYIGDMEIRAPGACAHPRSIETWRFVLQKPVPSKIYRDMEIRAPEPVPSKIYRDLEIRAPEPVPSKIYRDMEIRAPEPVPSKIYRDMEV